MEEIFKQSFTYARIKIFKNYSDRLTRGVTISTTEIDVPSPTLNGVLAAFKTYENPLTYGLRLYVKDKKKTNFFYTKTPTDSFINHTLPVDAPEIQFEPVALFCTKHFRDDCFETTKDRHIKAHYNNPFASMELIRVERWIKRDNDKITFKMFVQARNRNVNNIYFSKATHSTTITFNLYKGNFTIVTYEQGRKLKKKHFYCNSFNALKQSLPVFYNIKDSHVNKSSSLYTEYLEAFHIIPFQNAVREILDLKDVIYGTTSELITNQFIKEWMVRFAEIKQIKLPDNGERLLKWYYPTEKYLKKNDRKLVAAVLDRFGIKSKITIKILHECPSTSIVHLVFLCRLFGDNFPKYIGNIDGYFYSDGIASDGEDMSGKSTILYTPDRRTTNFILTNSEKENIVHILNDMCSLSPLGLQRRGMAMEFIDHFRMIDRLKPYYPEVQLNATKFNTFQTEHAYYSRLEREIQKGYSIQLIYEGPLIYEIEKPIEMAELIEPPIMYCPTTKDKREYAKMYENFSVSAIQRIFEPKVLTSSQEYFEEGCYMSHCVGGYVENGYSIIVSLRLGEERVTCEYAIKDRRCIQSRYFHNQNPPTYFEKALKKLNDRIRMIPVPIGPIDRKRVPIVINGVQVKPEVPIVFPAFEGIPEQVIF